MGTKIVKMPGDKTDVQIRARLIERICKTHRADEEKVMEILRLDKRCGTEYAYPNRRPYAGRCLPKDIAELKNSTRRTYLLDAVERVNKRAKSSYDKECQKRISVKRARRPRARRAQANMERIETRASVQQRLQNPLAAAIQVLTTGTSKYFQPHFSELQYFVQCLNQDLPPSPSGEDGLKDLEAISLAYKNQISKLTNRTSC
jgi:hypothetical protein